MENELKPFWNKYFKFDWKFGLLLLVIVCVPRFLLVLKANQTGNYGPIGAIMVLFAVIPFIFLSRYGRDKIGIRQTKKIGILILSIVSGLAASLILYFIGNELYGNSFANWYVYIANSYNIPEVISADDKLILFMVMAGTGMVFSPIGEELFFRGIVHSSFANSFGDKKASIIDSFAFALVHISHFGLIFINQQWQLLAGPTVIWVFSMFCVSILFFLCRRKTGSILGAILCHAAFNLGMIYCIFYLL